MNRLVVFALVLVLTLSVPASSLLAAGPAEDPTQEQTQEQTQEWAGNRVCVCDGANGDCSQYSYQTESSYSYKGESDGFFQFMWNYFFGGGGE